MRHHKKHRLSYPEHRFQQMCARKTPYPTEVAALTDGQLAYQCPYCGDWHRTSGKLRPYC